MPMIKLLNVSKKFGESTIHQNINIEFSHGKLTTLLGANGSGKSTLLKMIAGTEKPTSGTVTLNNDDIFEDNFSKKNDFFFIHEQLEINVPMSMKDYIMIMKENMPLFDIDLFFKISKERKISLDKNFFEYSRGQKMQVTLALGIASNSPILLIDEVTSVIDVYGRKYFLDLLDRYVKKGKTVIITTNIINELEFYTDNLIILKDQKIVLDKPVDEIPSLFKKIRQPNDIQHPVFKDQNCVWAGVNSDRSISFIISNEDYNRYNIPNEFNDKRKSTLEDVFIYYFTNKEDDIEEDAA